jgi:hypothetical protein
MNIGTSEIDLVVVISVPLSRQRTHEKLLLDNKLRAEETIYSVRKKEAQTFEVQHRIRHFKTILNNGVLTEQQTRPVIRVYFKPLTCFDRREETLYQLLAT